MPRLLSIAMLLTVAGCSGSDTRINTGDPQTATLVQAILPQRIEIQRYLTKPVSYDQSGTADGLEVVLGAFDSSGEQTKTVGRLHFELFAERVASGDRYGQRIAFWPVEIDSESALRTYWNPMVRFFEIPLRLESPLPPGRYILAAQLELPGGAGRLFDEYAFEHGPTGTRAGRK